MTLLYFVAALFAGPTYVHSEISNGQKLYCISLIQGVTLQQVYLLY